MVFKFTLPSQGCQTTQFKVSICTLFQISIVFFFDSKVRHREIFMRVYVCRAVFFCVTPPGQTKNDTDLKFSIHTPLDHI